MNNVRKAVTKESWDIIRRDSYAKYNRVCGTCGVSGVVLECHEIWDFDDRNEVQKLRGLIALCSECHRVKHFGFAMVLADQGKIDLDVLIRHFMKVNGCRRSTFDKHLAQSIALWEERSKKNWKIDLGECTPYAI